jgi:hypothetical protein
VGERGSLRGQLGEQAVDPAGLLQRHDDQRDQGEQDDEELHHLVVDGAGQPAEQDV